MDDILWCRESGGLFGWMNTVSRVQVGWRGGSSNVLAFRGHMSHVRSDFMLRFESG
jgi:hypothetical protein